MKAWRFHRSAYDPLDFTGAQIHGGRWNPKGVPVLYLSATYAGGLLESLTHVSMPRHPPRDHVASLVDIPDDAGISTLDPPHPPGWDHPDDYRTARRLAEGWLRAGEDLTLIVASVPAAPVERNLVINCAHPLFPRLSVVETIGPVYDPRIWG